MDNELNELFFNEKTRKINDLLDDLNNTIIENSSYIKDANIEDIVFNKKHIKVKDLLKVVDNYRNSDMTQFSLVENKERIFIYYGDPYLTLNLCVQALISQTSVHLIHKSFMNNVNTILIKIVKEIADKYNLGILIDDSTNYELNKILLLNSENSYIKVIGDTLMYQLIARKTNVKFYPYNNITLYSNSLKMEKIKQAIYVYANENNFEIEIIYESNMDKALNYIKNNELSNVTVLLTEAEEDALKFKLCLTNKELFVNENPFKNDVGIICNYFN